MTRRSAAVLGSDLAIAAGEVRSRSRGRCEAHTAVCTTWAADGPHHRRLRAQGGDDRPDNLLDICPPCHRWVHAHPAASYAAGWLLDAAGWAALLVARALDAKHDTP